SNLDFSEGLSVPDAASSGVALAAVFVYGSDAPSGVALVLVSGSDIPSSVGPAALYRVDSSVSSQSVSAPSVISSSTTSHDLPKSSKEAMKADYVANFNSYKGDNWVLSSGVRFDDKIFLSTIDKKNESSLHSFVLDSRGIPRYMKVFEDREVEDVNFSYRTMTTFKGEDAPTGFQEFNEIIYDFMQIARPGESR
ncbi:hypothetical protein BGX27_007778, partial [Mortierella sp. AM989]